ncbi:ribonuclease T2-like protein [Desarmillaria tabescens]|uniref:ribonuclease T2 n=1 Tax=Armillaria tabescens TaxID=1929756 RepID=A0AA39NIW7_ARMTA|nr:ribonuclease T2-like protein [Desarmillaria tabescens]KAK0466446.1 ribonuclease T2-like protein [Desarmillaria tabescens]
MLQGCSVPATYPNISSCVLQTPTYSCENTTAIANACCSPTPGGLVLKQGQLLPKGSWTIHGLWPDNCDGTCDLSRQYDPHPSPATLPDGTLNAYWINQGAPNADLWAHEFSKHATCTSTFDVSCYGASYRHYEEVVNFFDAVIRAFHQYPTFDILASAGIVPSNKTAYTLDQIQTSHRDTDGCDSLLGVWYYSHVYGTEQYGTYKTLDSTLNSSCSKTEPIWYYERTPSSEHEVRRAGRGGW